MAQNLKLEIFRISLKKKGGSNADLKNFEEFFKVLNTDKTKAYNEFIKSFVNYFSNEFKPNADGTKGISSNKQNKYEPQPSKNVINGELFGGNLGNEQVIYDQTDSSIQKGKVGSNQIASLPFYFKIWTPMDYTTGVLMVQSYSNYTITDLVKSNITKFFNNYDYSLIINPFVPEVIKEQYLKNSQVYKLNILKDGITKGKRKLINPLFAEFENLKITISVSGFKEDVSTFWSKLKRDKQGFIGSNLEDFDIKEQDDYEIKAYYKDEDGHKANVGIKRNTEIAPTIFLPDNMKKEKSNHYEYDKIKKHTDAILQNIQKEIGY